MVFQVEVTQEDIDHGIRMNCVDCPIALAIKRQTGKFARVMEQFVCLFRDEKEYRENPRLGEWFAMDRTGVILVDAFDRGHPTKPVIVVLTPSKGFRPIL